MTNDTALLPVARECGYRVAGGVYLASPTVAIGHPIEEFLLDPPTMIDCAALGISPVGAHIIMDPKSLVANVFDWIGNDYPTVARFVEEARKLGISRHVQPNLDWSRLDQRSQLFLIHPRGYIGGTPAYFDAEADYLTIRETEAVLSIPHATSDYQITECRQHVGQRHCGRKSVVDHHGTRPAMCNRLWWQDEDPSTGEYQDGRSRCIHLGGRVYAIQLACGASYTALARPSGVEARYAPAIVARFPLKIEVIRDQYGASHAGVIERIRKATSLQVTLEDS